MKKLLLTYLLLLCMAMNVQAVDVIINGITYEIISTEDLTVRVKGYADTQFSDVIIPDYIEYYGKQFKVIEIKERAFQATSIQTIKLPSTLRKIDERAFHHCEYLSAVEIPDEVVEIGIRSFCFCAGLKKVTFGRGLKHIPTNCVWSSWSMDYLFVPNNILTTEVSGITSLNIKDLVIEDSQSKLTKMYEDDKGSSMWEDKSGGSLTSTSSLLTCCNIQNLYLGRNISVGSSNHKYLPRVGNLTVGPYVTDLKGLFNLDYMQIIKLMPSTPPIFDRGLATEECYMRVKVYVPKGSLSAYKNHTEWGKYWNIEEYDDACEAPEISYEDGVLKVTPITSGSICYYTITDEDIVTDKEMTGGIKLTGTYNIEAYAVLNGSKSERSYATLCWLDNTFTGTGFTQPLAESKRPVIVKLRDGNIYVEGLEEGEDVDLYAIDGRHLGHTSATRNSASLRVNVQPGQIVVVRIGDNSIKIMNK